MTLNKHSKLNLYICMDRCMFERIIYMSTLTAITIILRNPFAAFDGRIQTEFLKNQNSYLRKKKPSKLKVMFDVSASFSIWRRITFHYCLINTLFLEIFAMIRYRLKDETFQRLKVLEVNKKYLLKIELSNSHYTLKVMKRPTVPSTSHYKRCFELSITFQQNSLFLLKDSDLVYIMSLNIKDDVIDEDVY
uniref:Uncharacterized protein n=1 Tax=Glossina brevipalpis TaxID=37001 RepID=A0A1A9WQW3_9MUSC